MKSIETIRSLDRTERRALIEMYREGIATLEQMKGYNDNPADTVRETVRELGYRPALLIVATLINSRTDDGRIDKAVKLWASGVDDSLDGNAAYELGLYSSIHPAHLNQIGRAMMEYSPYDDPTGKAASSDEPASSDEAPALADVAEIAPDHITLAGDYMPTEYRASFSGKSLQAYVSIGGETFRAVFSGVCGELFTACKRAMQGETVTVDADDLATVLGTAKAIPQRKPAEPNPDKQRHGEVPEKWFIGQEMTGKNWRILFDGDAGKTRVIFPRKPSAKAIEAVKAAGFYWSPALKSWNKGLNFRAFRAAEKLHAELHALTA